MKRRSSLLAFVALVSLAACSAPMAPEEVGSLSEAIMPNSPGKSAHLLPWNANNNAKNIHNMALQNGAAPAGSHLTYYGGPILSNTKVYTIFWNANVNYQTQLNNFYTGVTNSSLISWLTEYNTANQTLGLGSFNGSFVDNGAPGGNNITDAQIQGEITRLLNAHLIAANDPNMLYMVHFPPGVSITQGTSQSCVGGGFCAFHGTYTLAGNDVFYGVIPDQGGGCAGGCGANASQFNNTTSVASHEMIEAMTDPAVGLANTYAAPLAWYDATNGEIGDICNGQQGTVAGTNGTTYVIQLEFSNQTGTCIAGKVVANNFTVAVAPASATVTSGANAVTQAFTIATTTSAGNAQTVTFSLSGLAAGVTGSFNPASVTSGGTSTLTLTVAANAASSTSNFIVTGTATSGAHTAGGTLTVNGIAPKQLVANGGFETGNFSSWSTTGITAVIATAHSGTKGARVGSTSAFNGDSTITQNIAVPGTGTTTLSFYWQGSCTDTVQYDWQLVQVVRSGVVVATPVAKQCSTKGWTLGTADLTPYKGTTVTLNFLAHDDGYNNPADPTYMIVDDVSVTNQ